MTRPLIPVNHVSVFTMEVRHTVTMKDFKIPMPSANQMTLTKEGNGGVFNRVSQVLIRFSLQALKARFESGAATRCPAAGRG